MIKYPGAYLIASCKTQDCPFQITQIYFFLGLGKFDIAYVQKNAMCGGCRQLVSSVSNIVFYNCLWQYKGLTIDGETLESNPQRAGSDFKNFPLTDTTWKWLTVQALPLERSTELIESTDAFTQANLVQAEPYNDVVISSLTEEAQRYRDKYKRLKLQMKELLNQS